MYKLNPVMCHLSFSFLISLIHNRPSLRFLFGLSLGLFFFRPFFFTWGGAARLGGLLSLPAPFVCVRSGCSACRESLVSFPVSSLGGGSRHVPQPVDHWGCLSKWPAPACGVRGAALTAVWRGVQPPAVLLGLLSMSRQAARPVSGVQSMP